MKKWLILAGLVALMVGHAPSVFADSEKELTDEELKALRRILSERSQKQGRTDIPSAAAAPPSVGASGSEPAARGLEKLGVPRATERKYGSTMEGSGKLIYARPFVASPKAILGGYMDIEYINRANEGTNSFFDNHRLVPFIYGDVSDHVKFAAEIEIEHGEELGVEFAVIDYLVNQPVNLRAGLILLPLGKFNLLHDSPLRDLTDRPIVDQRIIPSTLRQAGAGFYGTFYPTRLSKLDYELYVTSGFTKAFGGSSNPDARSNITITNGIRSARSSNTNFDNNDGKAVVSRVAFSPILGVEIGGSGFFGSYDPGSKRPLSIWAIDWTLQRGPFELIGESAWAYIKDNNLDADGVTFNSNPRRMQGYYIQGNYHFLPRWMTRLAPTHFRPEVSTFTGIVRWEEVSLGQDLAEPNVGERQRLTLGLNFRPTEDTVFKTDFQYSPKEKGPSDTRIHDTAFLASWATYF